MGSCSVQRVRCFDFKGLFWDVTERVLERRLLKHLSCTWVERGPKIQLFLLLSLLTRQPVDLWFHLKMEPSEVGCKESDMTEQLNWTEAADSLWFCGYKICSSFWTRHNHYKIKVGVLIFIVQSLSHICDTMDCSTPGLPDLRHSWSLLKLMSTELVMSFNHLVLSHPCLLPPSIFPRIMVFCNESALLIR